MCLCVLVTCVCRCLQEAPMELDLTGVCELPNWSTENQSQVSARAMCFLLLSRLSAPRSSLQGSFLLNRDPWRHVNAGKVTAEQTWTSLTREPEMNSRMAGTCQKETKVNLKSRLEDTLGMVDYTHWLRQGKANSSQSRNQPIYWGLHKEWNSSVLWESSVSVKCESTKKKLRNEERQAPPPSHKLCEHIQKVASWNWTICCREQEKSPFFMKYTPQIYNLDVKHKQSS